MNTIDIIGQFQQQDIPSLRQNSSPDKLEEVAQEFESIFVKMMLDTMLASRNQENNLTYGGMAEDIFEDMLYTEYSRQIAKNGDFGIAEMIINQFSSNRHIEDAFQKRDMYT